MSGNDSTAIGHFFADKWPLIQRAIRSNVLCHTEMFSVLDRLLVERFADRPFRFVDFGCGDASAVINTLRNKPVAHYTGVDASSDLIATAAKTLAPLNFQKSLICQDMATAIDDLVAPVDVIFCSYSLHHLLYEQKVKFIRTCYERLNEPGYFILIDGVAMENETRDEWLNRLDRRFMEKVPDFSTEDRTEIMKHPRESDFPESIGTFRRIASGSPWKNFEVLIERDHFLAFMLFTR